LGWCRQNTSLPLHTHSRPLHPFYHPQPIQLLSLNLTLSLLFPLKLCFLRCNLLLLNSKSLILLKSGFFLTTLHHLRLFFHYLLEVFLFFFLGIQYLLFFTYLVLCSLLDLLGLCFYNYLRVLSNHRFQFSHFPVQFFKALLFLID